MIKRIKALINKSKNKRLALKEKYIEQLPKNSFSKKFYNASKDLKYETVIIKLPGSKILYKEQGVKNEVRVPFEFLEKLRKKGVDVSKCQVIHNHTISKKADLSTRPSLTDIKTCFNLYRKFKITNFSILFIDKKTMQEFGRCFFKLDSPEIKKKLTSFKTKDEYNIWFNNKIMYFGKPVDFFTIDDIEHLGFKLKFKGLNGNKYNLNTQKFEKVN